MVSLLLKQVIYNVEIFHQNLLSTTDSVWYLPPLSLGFYIITVVFLILIIKSQYQNLFV